MGRITPHLDTLGTLNTSDNNMQPSRFSHLVNLISTAGLLLTLLPILSLLQSPAVQASQYQELIDSITEETRIHWIDQPFRFPLLIRENQSFKKLGTIIIIPTSGHHGNWPGMVRHLRSELAKSGWNTVTLSLPMQDIKPVSERQMPKSTNGMTADGGSGSGNRSIIESGKGENILFSADSSSSKSQSGHSNSSVTKNAAAIASSYSYAFQELNEPFYIIAEGDSAVNAIKQLQKQVSIPSATTILINAKPSKELNKLIMNHKQLVMELVADHSPYTDAAIMRATTMSQKRNRNHFLKVLPATNSNFERQELLVTKSVRGMISRVTRR